MKNRKMIFGSILALSLAAGGVIAQGMRHPNLMAAQRLIDQAFQKISEAQGANEFDMNGHAQKAKDLLEQASREVKLAAEAANHH
jgi:hypothetical protein